MVTAKEKSDVYCDVLLGGGSPGYFPLPAET